MNQNHPAHPRLLKTAAALAATAGLMVLGTGAASAHVTVSPNKTNEGAYAQATFSVPNESDTAKTDKLTVSLPKDTPFTSVSIKPVEGWTAKIARGKLDKPVETHGTTLTEAATSITWTADKQHQIGQDEFQTFTASLGTLPTEGTEVVLPAAQHYTDGSVVNWKEASTDGQEPEHPAPSFTTTAATAQDAPAQASAASGTGDETTGEPGPGGAAGTAGLWIGVAGLLVGAIALVRTFGARRN